MRGAAAGGTPGNGRLAASGQTAQREGNGMTHAPTTPRPPARPGGADRRRSTRLRLLLRARLPERIRDDHGSATAEYAVVILAAVAFAGVLVAVMRSGEVQSILTELVRGALSL